MDLKPGGSDRPDRKPLLDIWEEILSPLSRGTCWIIRRCGGPGMIEKPKEDDNLAWITLRMTRDKKIHWIWPDFWPGGSKFALQKNSLIFVTRLEDLPTHPYLPRWKLNKYPIILGNLKWIAPKKVRIAVEIKTTGKEINPARFWGEIDRFSHSFSRYTPLLNNPEEKPSIFEALVAKEKPHVSEILIPRKNISSPKKTSSLILNELSHQSIHYPRLWQILNLRPDPRVANIGGF